MVRTPKKIANVIKCLKQKHRYTVREFSILMDLVKLVNSRVNQSVLEQIQSNVKELRRVEFREQFRSSAEKLSSKLNEILKMPALNNQAKRRFQSSIDNIKIFDKKLLLDTAEGVWNEIKGKTIGQVNWDQVKKHIKKVEEDLRALAAIEIELGKTIGVKL